MMAKTHSGPKIAEALGVTIGHVEAAKRRFGISLCKDGLNTPEEGEYFDWKCYRDDSLFVSYNEERY
jgi:hypothetical protein